MKSYIDYFEPGGKNDHYMYLNDKTPKLKTKEFIIASDIKKVINKFKNELMSYANVKKNLPKVNENSTTIPSISVVDHINNSINGNTGVLGLPIGFVYSDLRTSSGI